ncbi:g1937 [Coccomyxa elongata]
MPSVTALRRWLVFVALLRLFSVYLGVFQYKYFQSNLFDQRPELVNELYGRTFATWTVTTCALCLICAKNPRVPAIYGATLISFLAALVHFSLELLVFKTMSLKSAANPMIIAGLSALWMGAGWNYYTNLASEVEVSETESIEEASKMHSQKQE